jgi:hypothetical protein
MKTLTSVLILTALFLSAGAFAGNSLPSSKKQSNVTVIYKNQTSPTAAQIADRNCKVNFCREA